MSRRKKTPAGPPPSPWFRVHTSVRCAYGHDIGRGEMAYFNRRSRASICARCMKQQYDVDAPVPTFGFSGSAASDHRARQAGND